MKFLNHIDLNSNNELRNAVLQNLATAPSSPIEARMYWDTVRHGPLFWNNNASAWQLYATNSDNLGAQPGSFYLARTNHTGTQLAATISNLAAVVQAYTLDLFAAPVANVSWNNQRLTSLGDPVNAQDGVNLRTLQSYVSGLSDRAVVYYATAAALPANTYANGTAGVGATLTATGNGALSIDSVAVSATTGGAPTRVLIKNEVTTANNGIYIVTNAGSAGSAYILTRATDMDQAAEFGPGIMIPVEVPTGSTAGTVNNGQVFISIAPISFTVGTSNVTFTLIATTYTAGNGLSLTGTQFAVQLQGSSGLVVSGAGLAIDSTVIPRKFSTSIGDGSSTSIVVTHSLGTQDVSVTFRLVASTFDAVITDWQSTSTNTITAIFSVAPTTNQIRCTVIG